MKDCHWLKTINSSKKVTIKLSKRKDAEKIILVKKMKSMNLEWICISSPFLLNIFCVLAINIYMHFGIRTI